MAVTVAGKNYTQISSCDSGTAGGTWGGSPSIDTANKKEGTGSISDILKSAGANDWIFTPTSSVDLSGTKHLRIWCIFTHGGLIETEVNDGIQISISDGTNTGYYTVGGRDTYPGGWFNFCVDVSRTVDNGTKPTAMNAITTIGIRLVLTGSAKNADNAWVDNLCVCDGLTAYGDDAGGYFDFDDIFSADDTSLGIGIIRKIGGQYFLTGELEIGDSVGVNGCKFQAKSQIVIFEDRPLNSNLYNITVVDNGTGITEFILGDKSGTAGIQGCTIRVADVSQAAKFDIDGATDIDVDNFKLYASVFYGADAITFPAAGVAVEILGCSFEQCGQIIPDDANVSGCFFINTSDVDAALLWNESIDISDCSFVGNTTGAGIEMPSAVGTPYSYDALLFSGNTYDVLNSSGLAITVNKNNGSDPSTSEGSAVTFSASVTIEITVRHKETLVLLSDVQTSVHLLDSPYTQIMNEDTVLGVASESYSGSTPVNVVVKARKSEDTDNPRYLPFSSIDVVASSTGLTKTILLEESTILI